jgi:FkbM family methyltransferase
MKINNKESSPWRTFVPRGFTRLLLLLTKVGLGRGWIKYKIHYLWQSLHGNIVDVNIRRVNYRLDLSDNMTDIKILCSSKVYDQKELEFLQEICTGGTFVDIGANIGYYSLHMAAQGAKSVVAVEPHPEAIRRLRFNIKINNLSKVFSLYEGAIGDGSISCFDVSKDIGCSSHTDPSSSFKTLRVKTSSLLGILADFRINQISGLKIDIEGYEDKALVPFFENAPKGLWPRRMVIEDAHMKEWENDLFSILHDKGYIESFKSRSNIFLQKNF